MSFYTISSVVVFPIGDDDLLNVSFHFKVNVKPRILFIHGVTACTTAINICIIVSIHRKWCMKVLVSWTLVSRSIEGNIKIVQKASCDQ